MAEAMAVRPEGAAGADPNIRDGKFDATALGWAAHLGRPDFAELVRAKGGVR